MFRYFYNILIYGNIWIALGAGLMAIMHFQWIPEDIVWSYILTLFGASIFLYAIHRKIGLDENSERYDIRYKDFIQMSKESNVLGLIGLIITIGFGIFLPFSLWPWLVPAILLSGLYVMPIGKKKRRLRDYGIIKIPAQSLIWAWLIVIIPQVLTSNELTGTVWLIFIEKFLFLFAITIPFDIRDIKVDAAQGVNTLPQIFGQRNARLIAITLIGISMIIATTLHYQYFYNRAYFLALLLSYHATMLLITKSKDRENDFWFSFLLDGTLVLQPLLVMISACF